MQKCDNINRLLRTTLFLQIRKNDLPGSGNDDIGACSEGFLRPTTQLPGTIRTITPVVSGRVSPLKCDFKFIFNGFITSLG